MGAFIRGWLAAGLAAGVMLGAACSDNGDDEGAEAPDDGQGTTATVESRSDTPASGSDEEYVRDLCLAMDRFFETVQERTGNITPDDPGSIGERLADAFAPALQQFAEDMDKANPPEDAQEWHDDAVDRLKEAAKDLDEGRGLQGLAQLGDRPLPDPPAEIQERLTDAARDVPECEEYADAFSGG